jgi:serine/threonine protein kinase
MPNEQYSGKTMFASDIYAIGIITIQALTGLLPNQIPEDPVTSEFYWRDRAKVTPTLADVIDKMVRFDFRQRYQSASEVLEALQPLLVRSLAQTIFSAVTPIPLEEVAPNSDIANRIIKSPIDLLIEEVSDDFEMSTDPIRAKKLLCLVCTGILENDLQRLDNFSFVELLQDLYQQHPTIESLKENLVKAVKTIAIQKQRQYLIVAKIVFNLASKLYQRSPIPEIAEAVNSPHPETNPSTINPQITYSVSHLVINAGSAQLVAPLDSSPNSAQKNSPFSESHNNDLDRETPPENHLDFTEVRSSILEEYPNQDTDIYAWVAHDIDTDAQQMRLKKLLFYTYQDMWETDLRRLNSVDWISLLKEFVSFMPTFSQLIALLHEAVQRVSKPAEYAAIADLLLLKLERLYPDSNGSDLPSYASEALAPSIVPSNNRSNRFSPNADVPDISKIPFDPKIASDLFDLRLELMRFTNSMRAKILLFSTLYYPFNADRDNWQDLRTHGLDGLLRQLFYAYPSFPAVENAVWQTARSLTESSAYEQSATYILQVIKTLYDQLEAKSMHHPAEDSLQLSEDTGFTQPSAIVNGSDDDTCQFA